MYADTPDGHQPGSWIWSSELAGYSWCGLPNTWTHMTADLQSYPAGMRFAVVYLFGGEELPQYTGHWGTKFSAPELNWQAPGAQRQLDCYELDIQQAF